MKRRTIISYILISILAIFISVPKSYAGTGGVLSVTSEFDYKSSDDLNVYGSYIAGWFDNDDVYMYATWKESGLVEFREAYIKFAIDGLKCNLGRVIVPFGIEKLNRPQSSVFISSPTSDYEYNGLKFSSDYGIMNFDGAYIGSGLYSFRGSLNLFGENEKFMVSYTNIDELNKECLLSNNFAFKSFLFNASVLSEWGVNNGDFWTRAVFSPGIFDIFGLMVGYYNVTDVGIPLNDWTYSPDAWAYGFYFDIAKNVTTSLEWKDDKAFNPLSIKLVAKF